MPADGTMSWKTVDTVLGGEAAGSKAIHIEYNFPAGSSGGQSYESIHRNAYMPTTPDGITAFKMLKLGFQRRLNFTTGHS